MKNEIFYTNSQEETRELGKKIAVALNAGDIVALVGDLGSGKTTFVQGLAEGLGISNQVKSPSFTIVNEYKGKFPLYHNDLYRLDSLDDIPHTGIEDVIYGGGVVVIEWAERALPLLPPEYTLIRFYYTGENTRRIEVEEVRTLH